MASRRQTTLIILVVALILLLGGVIVFQFRDQIFTGVVLSEPATVTTSGLTTDPNTGFSWSMTKTALPTQVEPGESATYTLNWEITGQGLAGQVQIVDDYDQTAVSSISGLTQGGVDNGDIISWDFGNVDLTTGVANGSVSYTATFSDVLPALPYDVNNTATLSTLDPRGEDSDGALVTIAPAIIIDPPPPDPELAIVKNVEDINGDVVRRGDQLRYSIAIENIGQGTSTGILVTDNVGPYLDNFAIETFPVGATNGSTTTGGTNGTGFVSISDFNLTPGTSELITYTVNVASNAPDGQAIPNLALASDEQGNDVQDDASATVLVEAPPIEVLEGTLITEDPPTPTSTPTPPASIAQSSGSTSTVTTPTSTTPTSTAQPVVVPETGIDPRAAVWLIFAVMSALGISLYTWYVLRRVLR